MKILIKNTSKEAVPYLMRLTDEKVGYIYRLKPGDELEAVSINTHNDGLIAAGMHGTIYSLSYEDFSSLEISYVKR